MILRLSNTAIDRYTACPMYYKLYYIDKLRPTYTMSPLVFGRAIDEALNRILLEKKRDLTEEEKKLLKLTPKNIFYQHMQFADINGDQIDISKSHKIDYYKSDVDLSIIQSEDYKLLESCNFGNIEINVGNIGKFIQDCHDLIKAKKAIDLDMKKVYNYICWLSLCRKGTMLIDAYRSSIFPEIVEVHKIQEEVNLENEEGDYIIGYIDYEATFKDGVRRIMDNKTTSQNYKEDCISDSQQLAIYSEYKENRNVGYSVLNKKLKVRDPKVKTQLIFGEISEELLEKVFDKIGKINYNIKSGSFPKNKKNCFAYQKKCPYLAKDGSCTNRENIVCVKE